MNESKVAVMEKIEIDVSTDFTDGIKKNADFYGLTVKDYIQERLASGLYKRKEEDDWIIGWRRSHSGK